MRESLGTRSRPQRALSAWPHFGEYTFGAGAGSRSSSTSSSAPASAWASSPTANSLPRRARRGRRGRLPAPRRRPPPPAAHPRRGMLEDAVSADASGPHRPRPRHDRAHRQARLRRLTPAPATRPPAPPCARRANACSPSPSPLRHRRLTDLVVLGEGRADLLLSHGGRNPAPPHSAAAPVSRPARHGDDAVPPRRALRRPCAPPGSLVFDRRAASS